MGSDPVKSVAERNNMKREEALAILNSESNTEEKLDKIMDLYGAGITAERKKFDDLKKDYDNDKKTFQERQDYGSLKERIAALESEKAERDFSDRFQAAIGDKKPLNDYTRKGLLNAFRAEIEKQENQGKKDEEIFDAIVKDHESEYFMSNHTINFPRPSTDAKAPSDIRAEMDARYANNPFYKKE